MTHLVLGFRPDGSEINSNPVMAKAWLVVLTCRQLKSWGYLKQVFGLTLSVNRSNSCRDVEYRIKKYSRHPVVYFERPFLGSFCIIVLHLIQKIS